MTTNAKAEAPIDTVAYDAWFQNKVQAALDDDRPAVPHDDVRAHFAKRKAAVRAKG